MGAVSKYLPFLLSILTSIVEYASADEITPKSPFSIVSYALEEKYLSWKSILWESVLALRGLALSVTCFVLPPIPNEFRIATKIVLTLLLLGGCCCGLFVCVVCRFEISASFYSFS